ncbi:MAG: FadR family transcriptional regulator [Proteobacteria bacterium]|nr:FadR family transcriptional regulator [Pseudomonadota bacterium]
MYDQIRRPRNRMFKESATIARNVHSQVADRIGALIVRGEIAPGEPLPSEVKICETLDVSRTVVREAIRTLTGKGLVESRAKSGTRVRPREEWNQLDVDVLRWQLEHTDVDSYLAKVFELRNAMEPTAAALAATAATDDDRRLLREAYDAMVAARSNAEFVAADIAFHKRLYIASRNEFFWPIAQMFEITLRESFRLAALGDHRPRAFEEHREVMEAIVARDAERAWTATRVLLGNASDDLVRIRGRNPFQKR